MLLCGLICGFYAGWWAAWLRSLYTYPDTGELIIYRDERMPQWRRDGGP